MNTFLHVCRFIGRPLAPRVWRRLLRPLSLVLLLATGLWLSGSYVAQWWLVGRLVRQIGQASDVEAPRLVHELARREARAYEALVQAANSPRSAVALSARREIDTRLDSWQRESYLSPSTFDLASTAFPMARAFRRRAAELGPSASRWALRAIEQLTAVARSQSLDERLALLAQCERALAILPRDSAAAALADSGRVSLPIRLGDAGQAADQLSTTTVPNPPLAPPHAAEPVPSPPVVDAVPPAIKESDAEPVWQRVVPLGPPVASDEVANLEPSTPKNFAPAVPARPASVSHPRRLPPEVVDEAEQLTPQPPAGPMTWFELLVRGDEQDQLRAQEKLLAAGFGQVRRGEALMLVSASIDDRKLLVDRVLTSSRLEAPAWLELLLMDQAPEVRAAAVAAIATTSDQRLLERAMEIALGDSSPAVADQVPLIRQRLR